MTYEITTPGKNDARITMNVSRRSLAEARKEAQSLANRDQKPMYIDRVTARGNSTHVETVRPR